MWGLLFLPVSVRVCEPDGLFSFVNLSPGFGRGFSSDTIGKQLILFYTASRSATRGSVRRSTTRKKLGIEIGLAM